jgi:FkbM family methyltransferase
VNSLKYGLRRVLARSAPDVLAAPGAAWLLGFRQEGEQVEDIADGIRIVYDRGTTLGERLFFFGTFEAPEIHYAAERLRRRPQASVILDVGANIGWHAVCWARHIANSTIIAFEPSPATAARLRHNVRANGLDDRIEVVEMAVANQVGTTRFFECADSAYSSIKDTGRSSVQQQIDVACTTIDRFTVERGLVPALLKVDVEGLEHEVLLGARRCLVAHHPDLLIEIYQGDRSNADPEATVRFLQELGYRAVVFAGGEPTPYVRHADERYNYFFCRDAP